MTKKECEIKNFMEKLGITREEAEQLWEDDQADIITPEMAEYERKRKENCKMYEKADTGKKKKTVTRKVDTVKLAIFEIIMKALADMVTNVELHNEASLDFTYDNKNYTLKLVEHRPPKK